MKTQTQLRMREEKRSDESKKPNRMLSPKHWASRSSVVTKILSAMRMSERPSRRPAVVKAMRRSKKKDGV
jgi:hypothetical protein